MPIKCLASFQNVDDLRDSSIPAIIGRFAVILVAANIKFDRVVVVVVVRDVECVRVLSGIHQLVYLVFQVCAMIICRYDVFVFFF